MNFNALAISQLTVNDQRVAIESSFKNQRISLEKPNIMLGWNTVQLRYLNKYGTTSVGLHTYTDNSD